MAPKQIKTPGVMLFKEWGPCECFADRFHAKQARVVGGVGLISIFDTALVLKQFRDFDLRLFCE